MQLRPPIFAIAPSIRLIALLLAPLAALHAADAPKPAPNRSAELFPGFDWDRVPLNIHFGKRGQMTDGGLDSYPESQRPLGQPQADATWKGLTATRDFAHASVWIDLATKQARIDWK
jgi:hypothetical protein